MRPWYLSRHRHHMFTGDVYCLRVPRRTRASITGILTAVLLASFVAGSGPVQADDGSVLVEEYTVTNVTTGENLAPTVVPPARFPAGTTLKFALRFQSNLDGSSHRMQMLLEPGSIVLNSPRYMFSSIGYEYTIPADLDPNTVYTLVSRTEPGGTVELTMYTFFRYSFQVEPEVAASDTVTAPSPAAVSTPSTSPVPEAADPAVPTATATSTPTASAATTARPPRDPAPSWPWILVVSLAALGAVGAAVLAIVRRVQRNQSYRRLAGR